GDYPPEYGMYPPPGDYVDDPYYDPYYSDPYHDDYYDQFYNACAGSDPCDWNCDGVVDSYELRECSDQNIDYFTDDGYNQCDFNRDGIVDGDEFDYCNKYDPYYVQTSKLCDNVWISPGNLNYSVLSSCFNTFDLNSDGIIDSYEAWQAKIADFPYLNKIDDGLLSLAEATEVLENCDINPADGEISAAEASVCDTYLPSYIDAYH
ncbi:MAG: hypothetical protein ISR63_07480, partial [Desulfobacterales bacterium]|nr:hypothetical protein [Desulfobacterales bacterium]